MTATASPALQNQFKEELLVLNKKYRLVPDKAIINNDWESVRVQLEERIAKLSAVTKWTVPFAYVLVIIICTAAFIRTLFSTPVIDLNKAGLLIFIAVTNLITTFHQQLTLARLKQQLLLLRCIEQAG